MLLVIPAWCVCVCVCVCVRTTVWTATSMHSSLTHRVEEEEVRVRTKLDY